MATTRTHWYELLEALAARNAAVQATALVPTEHSGANGHTDAGAGDGVSGADGGAEPAPIAESVSARLLAVDADESLTLELPPTREHAAPLRAASWVDVLTVHEGQRSVGRCPVRDLVHHRLNEQTCVPALRLGPAEQVRSAQRREFFRVEMTGTDAEPVRLVPDGPAATPPFHGRLLNLSGGGMGLRAERIEDASDALQAGRRYACRIELPGESEPIDVHATLVHVELTRDRTLELGMAFDFATDSERRRVQDRIVRFATELERKRLQRRRRTVA